ncbi:MAG TPA: carboxypeptidase-like regulatory domain-containing protein, partial [Polyangia bacterium]|nr:carboxypeptidase-like regulatory domain-containing protein [Polyangia bacterium]
PETSGLPVQDSRIELIGTGFSPTTLDLMTGNPVTLATYADVVRLPAYVRISSAVSRVALEGYTGRQSVDVVLLPYIRYDVLLVPDGPFAPKLLSNTPDMLPRMIEFDPGTPVTGRALDGRGQPVVDARVVLRAGARPSTVGRSDASGAFDLLTRGGTMSVEVNAPDGSGLPNLRVAAVPGVVLQDGTGLDLTVKWAASTTARLQIAVSSNDGATPIAGAVVRVASTAVATDMLGQLLVKTTGASAATEIVLPATGAVKVEATSTAAGTATFPALPTGPYLVTVIPPAQTGTLMAATTTASVDVPAADLTRAIRLARKVKLSGTLLPSALTAGVRITAIDDDTRASTTATAAAGGRYELLLDPGRSYRLWAQPTPAQVLGRAGLGGFTAGSADGVIPDRTVPRGIVFDGHVMIGGSPVTGALIQAFCLGSSTACLDPNLSVADAVSGVSGEFRLTLPDPGATQN